MKVFHDSCAIITNMLMYTHKFDTNSKRNELRNQIRRKQIEHYFDTTRIKYNEQFLAEQKTKIKNDINDSPDRKIMWIQQRAQQLRILPSQQWTQVLRLLSLGCGLYRGDYGNWVDSGVVARLVRLVQDGGKFAAISACILQQIFYGLPQDKTMIPKILNSKLIQSLIHLTCNSPIKQSLIYFQLINTILFNRQNLSNAFIDKGFVHILVKILSDPSFVDQNQGDAYIVVSVVYRMLRGVVLDDLARFGSNVLLVFVPVLGRILVGADNKQLLGITSKCLSIMAKSRKQYILAQLFYTDSLINTLLKFLTVPEQTFLRSVSTNILASILSSQNPSYPRELIHKDILIKLKKCWQFKDNDEQCRNNILKILSNIVSTSLDLAKIVIFDEVFGGIVVASARKVQFQKNYADSIFILSTLIQYGCPQIVDIVLRKYYILEILIQGLKYDVIHLQNCLEILKSLVQIVQFEKQAGFNRKKKIILELEGLYNIQDVLQKVQEKMVNTNVQYYISILIEEMYGEG